MSRPCRRLTGCTSRRALAVVLLGFLSGLAHAGPGDSRYPRGEVLVRFKDTVSARTADRAHAALRASVAHGFTTVRNLHLVKLPSDVRVEDALAAYRHDPAVAYAEPNYEIRIAALPDDPQFPDMSNLSRIDAPDAWDLTTGSSDVVVAVTDTGIDYAHPDLAANVFRNEGDCDTNGVDDDHDGFVDDCFGIDFSSNDSDPFDDNGHGTHVAGIIGAVGNNGLGVVGVNWRVKILACKMLGADGVGTIDDAIRCIDYILAAKARGVNVVATNASWGGADSGQALLDAIEALRQAGILFVTAAGNASTDLDVCPDYPAAYDSPGIVAVAATDDDDGLAFFSNFGASTAHLGAPGVGIVSTFPNGAYRPLNGTSMAAPHVAGLAALIAAQDPLRDWKAIKNLLISGGDPVSSLATTTISGRRLNARGALDCQDSVVLAALHPARETLIATQGVPFDASLSALHLRCDAPAGDVIVTAQPGNETITLRDDGAGADIVGGDGVYTAHWTPTLNEQTTLTYPDGSVQIVNVWPQVSNLLASPAPTIGEGFAQALAMSGANVFVSTPTTPCGGGAVHVFDRDTGAFVRTIVPPLQPTSAGPVALAREFGAALATDGGRLLIGAPGGLPCVGCGEGEALLYDATTGDLLQILLARLPPATVALDVGAHVAIAGNNVVVAAPGAVTRISTTVYIGAVLLFDAATGALRATLLPPTENEGGSGFGRAVAATADRAAVTSGRKVHVYDADPASPSFGQILRTYDGADYDVAGFGDSLAYVGSRLVVGAAHAWDLLGSRANGGVFVFDGPTLVRTIVNPVSIDEDPTLVTMFGMSLAAAGGQIAIGAPDANPDGRGAAYLMDLDSGPPTRTIRAVAALAGSGFGTTIAAQNDLLVVGAPRAFEGSAFGAAFRFSSTLGFPPTLVPVKSFKMQDDNLPPIDLGRRSIRLKAKTSASSPARIMPAAPGAEGDPTIHGAVLTVYNAAGLTADAVTVSLPATGAEEGWRRVGRTSSSAGYVFKSRSPSAPISGIVLKRDRLTIRGGKQSWTYTLDEPAQGAVAVRLTLGETGWCSVIPARTNQDHIDLFVGQPNASPPAVCPAVP